MAHTYLLFDFGKNEDAAQQARLSAERWKQAYRLDKKLLVKFDRGDQAKGEAEAAKSDNPVKLIIRLDFSDHEKLSHQRWTDRIPTENLFREAQPKIIKQGDPEFAVAEQRFEALP